MIEKYWWIWPLTGFICLVIAIYQDKKSGSSFSIADIIGHLVIYLMMGPVFIFTIIPRNWWYYITEWKVIKGDR